MNSSTGSLDDELFIIPSEDSQEKTAEERLGYMLRQRDFMVSTMNQVTSSLKSFKLTVGDDPEDFESRLIGVDARVGVSPIGTDFEDCGSVCDGRILMDNNVREIVRDKIVGRSVMDVS